MDDYRRQISEVVALYELEPTEREIFVEGDSDKTLIEWLLATMGISEVVVTDIGAIEIPADCIAGGVVGGNRGRVKALGIVLESALPPDNCSIRCVVDADLDRLLNQLQAGRYMLYTDFTCAEMYCFSEACLRKFFALYLRKPYSETVIESLATVLREMFLIRGTLACLPTALVTIDWGSDISLTGHREIAFDRDRYVSRLLQRNGHAISRAEFDDCCNRLRDNIPDDTRHYCHGHDFVNTLIWYAKKLRVQSALTHETPFSRALVTTASAQELLGMPLFAAIVAWATHAYAAEPSAIQLADK